MGAMNEVSSGDSTVLCAVYQNIYAGILDTVSVGNGIVDGCYGGSVRYF